MNIFERLASQNDSDEWSNLVKEKNQSSATEFSKIEAPSASSGNIFDQLAAKEKARENNKFSFLDYAKDIGQQVLKKGASGILGAYGNLLDVVGAQIPEGKNLPGQEQVYNIQSQILDKMNRGEKLSFSELMFLSDDDVVPNFNRLPTSKEVDKAIEGVTGVGEGKTAAGRIAGRGAEFVGEGLATGGGLKTLAGLAGSGLAGQSIREIGGPELAASATEIAGSLAPSAISKKLSPLSKSGKATVEAGKKIGLTESQITPLLQSERKLATVAPVARKGGKTKELFSEIKNNLGDSYARIKSLSESSKVLPKSESSSLMSKFKDIKDSLSKTLAPSPDKQGALDYIEKALASLSEKPVTPEHLINFWQDINKSVKWNSINGGKKALAKLKEPVGEVLKKVSPQIAEDFELTNQLYTKYSQIAKKLKPDLVDSFVNKGEILAIGPSALALATGNPWPLSSLGSEVAIRTIAREMLTNPYFQTIAGKLVNNFNAGSVKAIEGSVKQVQEFMQRKHPEEDWSFLTQVND